MFILIRRFYLPFVLWYVRSSFDSNHILTLVLKFLFLNIPSSLCNYIFHYFIIANSFSSPLSYTCLGSTHRGFSHGCCHSPIFFYIYMINISNSITSFRYSSLFYANDVIYSTNKSLPNAIIPLNNALQTLSPYIQLVYLDPAMDKSHSIIFTQKQIV